MYPPSLTNNSELAPPLWAGKVQKKNYPNYPLECNPFMCSVIVMGVMVVVLIIILAKINLEILN